MTRGMLWFIILFTAFFITVLLFRKDTPQHQPTDVYNLAKQACYDSWSDAHLADFHYEVVGGQVKPAFKCGNK